jgi:uncharacterized membrane protein
VGLDVAVVRFDGEGTAVRRYADAKDRSDTEARWAREVGFVERHKHGHLLLRGTFAGHYVDVDESDHVSQKGAGEGAVAGGLVGVLLGPAGIAVGGGLLGVLLGPAGIAVGLTVGGIVGSQAGKVSDSEAEPRLLADQLRDAVPRASSAIVLIAAAPDVDEMLAAMGEGGQSVTRRTLTADETARLEDALSAAPPASPER